jgi:hypothetical protein
MKTQLERSVSGKSHYTAELKEEALAKWRQSGRSAARVAAERATRVQNSSGKGGAALIQR